MVRVVAGIGHPPGTDVEYVRGVVVAHPVIRDLATEARFRRVAAEEGLRTMLMSGFTWVTERNWERLEQVLDAWAEASGHPELRGAPVLVSGAVGQCAHGPASGL